MNARSAQHAHPPWREDVPTAAASCNPGRAAITSSKYHRRPRCPENRKAIMLNDPIVIVGAARTPMGGFQGDFASLAASDLGAVAIKAAVERAGIKPGDVDRAILGCVL